MLAIAREQCGDYRSSIAAYESALALLPDHAELANDLGRLAFRMGMPDLAARLFAIYRDARPDDPEGANNLACALRDLHHYQEAIDVLTPAITASPAVALLWNTLATVLIASGQTAAAMPFLEEAIRLEPSFAKARYTRAHARLEGGDVAGALADNDVAMANAQQDSDLAMMRFARSQMLLVGGRVAEGWEAYEARFAPQFAGRTSFVNDRPMWKPTDALSGKSMLLIGEQGLGDEVMFANDLPDLIEALGPTGRLTVALEPRLIPLFQRSFPTAIFCAHATYKVDGHSVRLTPDVDAASIDLWAPLASPLRRFRPTVESFPQRASYMTPDPDRVRHWRAVLDALPGRKVGVLVEEALKLDGARMREFSPFALWREVLRTPGVSFVNLQYGDSARQSWRKPGPNSASTSPACQAST